MRPLGSCAHATLPSNACFTSPTMSRFITMSCLFGALAYSSSMPYMSCCVNSIVPFAYVLTSFSIAARPPVASMDLSMTCSAVSPGFFGAAAGFAFS